MKTIVAVLSMAVTSAAAAQTSGDGFLFGTPKGSLSLRAGYAAAAAGSDLFEFTTDLLTVDRRDFSGPGAELDATVRLGPRTHLVFSAAYARARKRSEFRNFVDQDNNPIEQTTRFDRYPMTVGIRRYLTSPGRAIGKFAWVPAKVVPFVGLSAGMVWYEFLQTGDFIDFNDNSVFTATLSSHGLSPIARAMAGAEYTVRPRLALTIQGSYQRSSAQLSADFSGFDRLDLSGFSTNIGLATRF